jgi:hypothetical protein
MLGSAISCFLNALEMVAMVTMAARWPGKCKRCGNPIATGAPINWNGRGNATHLTETDCASAPATLPPLRGPQSEDPEERMMIVDLLLTHPWKSATSKRYEKLPHQYTLRKQWADDEAFLWCVSHVRKVGYEKFFIGRIWVYYDIGPDCYWDCGGPVANVGLINRAVRKVAK